MYRNLLKSTLLLLGPLLFSLKSPAYLTSSFDINLGQSSFSAKTSNEQREIDSFSTIEMNYSLRNSSAGVSYALSFFELVNSKEGSLAITRLSFGPRWYPLGMNGSKVLIDNDVIAKIWKATPYLGGSLGLTNLSTKDYNASLYDLGIRFGVEVPLSPSMLLNAQYIISQSLSSSSKGEASNVSYSGSSITIGILVSGIAD